MQSISRFGGPPEHGTLRIAPRISLLPLPAQSGWHITIAYCLTLSSPAWEQYRRNNAFWSKTEHKKQIGAAWSKWHNKEGGGKARSSCSLTVHRTAKLHFGAKFAHGIAPTLPGNRTATQPQSLRKSAGARHFMDNSATNKSTPLPARSNWH